MPRKREEERNQKTMHTMNEPMTVRFATEEDAPVVYRFIRKMAEYEKSIRPKRRCAVRCSGNGRPR